MRAGVGSAAGRPVPAVRRRRCGRHGQRAGPDQGGQGQQGRGGIAPRCGDESGTPEVVPVQLGEPVDEAVQELGGRVGLAVPGGVEGWIGQAEVGGQVHHGPDVGDEVGHQMLGLAVGQRQEDQIQTVQLPHLGRCVHERGIGGRQGGGVVGHGLAAVPSGRGHHHLQFGVTGTETEEFDPGVTGGSDDAHLHGFSLTLRSVVYGSGPAPRNASICIYLHCYATTTGRARSPVLRGSSTAGPEPEGPRGRRLGSVR